jgi:thioester reductase-like protein
MNILITGATGFIGKRLIKELSHAGHKLFLLVRPQSKIKAQEEFKDLSNIILIDGDVEDTDVVKNIYFVAKDIDSIECVIHLAALYSLDTPLTPAYVSNVIGTQNILHLMTKMRDLKYFHYFSTYAVNPISQGNVREDDLIQDDLLLPDFYSKTKNHAEHMVRKQTPSHVRTVIYRPGIVIGDSKTGIAEKKDGPYFFFDLIQNLKNLKFSPNKLPFLPIPTTATSLFPVIPVDVLVEWSSHIIQNPPKESLRCYHMVPFPVIGTKDFLEESMRLLDYPVKILAIKHTKLIASLLPVVKIPKEAAVYLNQQTYFDRSNLTNDYPDLTCPKYKEYLPVLINEYLRQQK